MFKSKKELTERRMPTAEEFALWGAYELSFEELLAVNGGKRDKERKEREKFRGREAVKIVGRRRKFVERIFRKRLKEIIRMGNEVERDE